MRTVKRKVEGPFPVLFSFPSSANDDVIAAMTVRWLSRCWGLDHKALKSLDENGNLIIQSRLIVCTGERMKSLVTKLYRPQGVATTNFLPVHAKGLSNEFYCYANFECDDWEWDK